MNEIQQYFLLFLGSTAAGYVLYYLIKKFLPVRLRNITLHQREEVLKEARKQRKQKFEDILQNNEEKIKLLKEETLEEIQQRREDLKVDEGEVKLREDFLASEEARLKKFRDDIYNKKEKVDRNLKALNEKRDELAETKRALAIKLSERSNTDLEKEKANISGKLIENRNLECQKVLKSLHEELDSSARKTAQRVLDRVSSRYTPEFTWPKSSNFIEVKNKRIAEEVIEEDCALLNQLKELSGVEIQGIEPSRQDLPTVVKVAGGYGIYREAARLALTEILARDKEAWIKAPELYQKHKEKLEREAELLGQKAVNLLRLPDIHPEIQKLVGALNWRTSYRQNQWHHTVEVAILAGVLASELGVDPQEAKRVGMLHDIGKAIDYRIEGSHAVISGDYADRFGENRIICDTVMSHHSDLIVETPLAYVLRAADTLSGARPGARVNLEEGYQIRLTSIAETVRSFEGISDLAIMNGGREVHIQVNNKKVKENDLKSLTEAITRKIEEDVTFPGQIKVLVSRSFESVTVA